MNMKRLLLTLLIASLACSDVLAQDDTPSSYRKFLTPELHFGLSLNVDANGLHSGRYKETKVPDGPVFSASLAAIAYLGVPDDLVNLSLGVGYRGLFDQTPPHEFITHPSFSDYMIYVKEPNNWRDESNEVRPIGGLLVFPFELHLNILPLGSDSYLFVGSGAEYAIRLYQPERYERYFGAHVLNRASLSVSPLVGLSLSEDDMLFNLSLYFRHYLYNCFNTKDLPIGKFSHNHIGAQISVAF